MAPSRPFRFSVQLHTHTPEELLATARRAEDLGYSAAFLPDHFGHQLAPVPALAAVAAATTTLRIGTLVFDNDYRHPVVLAMEAATLDVLSAGRLELGLGAGWMASDYHKSGIALDPPKVRIDRMEEAVTVLKNAFADGAHDFRGEHYTVTGHDGFPKPLQKPHPPLLIGAGRKRMLTIAAREADIVGINPSMPNGVVDADAAKTGLAEATDEKVAWVREAAGDRYDSLEINFLQFAGIVTDDRASTYESLAPLFGVSPADVAAYPYAMIGSVDEICEGLEERRARWDASYFTIPSESMDAMAPVVARLAGT